MKKVSSIVMFFLIRSGAGAVDHVSAWRAYSTASMLESTRGAS
jgi:hypothetical protein